MAYLWIEQYAEPLPQRGQAQEMLLPSLPTAVARVDFTSAAAKTAAALRSDTTHVRLYADTNCCWVQQAQSAAAAATVATGIPLSAGMWDVRRLNGNDGSRGISVIAQ